MFSKILARGNLFSQDSERGSFNRPNSGKQKESYESCQNETLKGFFREITNSIACMWSDKARKSENLLSRFLFLGGEPSWTTP
jgi:hypothetical protein